MADTNGGGEGGTEKEAKPRREEAALRHDTRIYLKRCSGPIQTGVARVLDAIFRNHECNEVIFVDKWARYQREAKEKLFHEWGDNYMITTDELEVFKATPIAELVEKTTRMRAEDNAAVSASRVLMMGMVDKVEKWAQVEF